MSLPIPGEPAPAFSGRTTDGQTLDRDTLAGGFTTLCLFGSAGHAAMAAMLDRLAAQTELFDGESHRLIGVSIDPDDEREDRLPGASAGVRMLLDFDQSVSRAFGALDDASTDGADDGVAFQPLTVLLDAAMRVLAVHRIDDPDDHPVHLCQFLQGLPSAGPPRPAAPQAPVLLLPMVFETELCRRLIAHFDTLGGQPSGLLEDVDGKTALTFDPGRKQRQDALIADETLRTAVQIRVRRRLIPEIRKAFQFEATRMERSVVTRYAAGDFCGLHRDNAALGTAHRQFAVTIPLNAETYSGGLLRFPEYGPQLYPIPTGCALVHSCSLLHEVTPVREGTRYAFIPVLFNEAAARLHEASAAHLAPGVTPDRREFVTPATGQVGQVRPG